MTDSSDRTSLKRSMWANVVMAVASIAAAIAAFIGIAVTAQYSRQTVIESQKAREVQEKSARDTLAETIRARESQEKRLDEQLLVMDKSYKDSLKDKQVQQANFEQVRKEERQRFEDQQRRWRDEREADAKRDKKARSPDLIQHNCCNEVALIERTMPNGVQKFGLPANNTKNEIPQSLNLNAYYVAQIVNVGQGPAKFVKATWFPQHAIKKDGTILNAKLGTSYTGQTDPFYIQAGQAAFIRHLPMWFVPDTEEGLSSIDGYLELTCLDSDDDVRQFRYRFSMTIRTHIHDFRDGYFLDAAQLYIADKKMDDQPVLEPTPGKEMRDSNVRPAF